MNKRILVVMAAILSIFAFKSAMSQEASSVCGESNTAPCYATETSMSSTTTVTSGPTAIDCSECCKAGRWVSTECARNCNRCVAFDDEASAESDDYPF